ncbi:CDP-diacylglycerol--inositol 3-phosphatidyltransferase isoform X2 [Lagenorhynchus albirostris]|uniref:CDP-diacylglycerol--inositol 3-phosphatidyltransferase isoform X2 n=1 Tax=Lagenorhynchus albirostris TaxID=27610 RepID=UPI0028EFA596|nr:CDP-diacylglycerol--inositol 3-phosphatidyltransferase isoform X2 [Lagenorhynchus albirostris]
MPGENIFLFVPNLIGYARIVFAIISFYFMPCCPLTASSFYLLSGLLDAFDGHAARALNQGTRFGAMLDMLTDRCSTMCLLVNLALLYPRATLLFQLSMSLDVASHWLHLHSWLCRSFPNGPLDHSPYCLAQVPHQRHPPDHSRPQHGCPGRSRSCQEEVILEPPAPGYPPALGVSLCHAAPLSLLGGPRHMSSQCVVQPAGEGDQPLW